MTRRAGSVVAAAARGLAPAAVVAMLAACGQKGPLALTRPAYSPAASAVAPSTTVVPPAAPASATAPR